MTNGLAPPEISSSEIAARLSTIRDQADTLLFTDLHNPEFAVVGNISTNCRAGTCITSEGQLTLDDLTVEDTEFQAVMTRNGITLLQYRTETKDADGITAREIGYGAWLDHNAFSTSLATYYRGAVSDGYYAAVVAGFSVGNDSGSRPVGGSATWTGVMTGADLEFQNAVQGDAAVTVDFARNNAGVAFTNIKDLGTRSGLPLWEWSGLAIGTDGRFGASDIKATFYGRTTRKSAACSSATTSLERSAPSASRMQGRANRIEALRRAVVCDLREARLLAAGKRTARPPSCASTASSPSNARRRANSASSAAALGGSKS